MSVDVTRSSRELLSVRVAEEIRSWMARRRLSGAALARALNVSPAWVSYRLTGVQPIDLNELERIAAVLNVEVAQLLPISDEGRVVATGGRGGLNNGSGDVAKRTNAKLRQLTRHPVGRPGTSAGPSSPAVSPSQRRPGLVSHRSRD